MPWIMIRWHTVIPALFQLGVKFKKSTYLQISQGRAS